MVPDQIASALTHIINNCISQMAFPSAWKKLEFSQYRGSKKPNRCHNQLQSAMDHMSSWSNECNQWCNLTLNADKTKVVLSFL